MTSRRASQSDWLLALVLLAVGFASIAVALRRSAGAFHFLPAMDGCLTAGVFGFVLAILEGVPYRRALLLLAPLVAIQLVGARVYDASWLAVIGVDALAAGLIGAVLGLLARNEAPRARERSLAPRPAPMRRPRPAHAH